MAGFRSEYKFNEALLQVEKLKLGLPEHV